LCYKLKDHQSEPHLFFTTRECTVLLNVIITYREEIEISFGGTLLINIKHDFYGGKPWYKHELLRLGCRNESPQLTVLMDGL
jgi:hypothetical protein